MHFNTSTDVIINCVLYIKSKITIALDNILQATMAIVLPRYSFKIRRFPDEFQDALASMLNKSPRFGSESYQQCPNESSFEIRSSLDPIMDIRHLKNMWAFHRLWKREKQWNVELYQLYEDSTIFFFVEFDVM